VPETEHSVLDFWAVARDFARADDSVTDFLAKFNHTVVMQDVDALNILEKIIAAEPEGFQELSINIDTGALAARRMLKQLAEGAPVAV
jgi:phenylpropionate dioxygenase-like ring-hydroxylating dioxygenase large terminal subunit